MLRGCRLGRGWMLGGSVSPSKFFFFFFFPSSIDQYSEEGGTSDVAGKLLGCVRVQLSQGRRKQGIKRERGPELDALCHRDKTRVVHAADGHTDAQDMEGSAEEDYKEKLLWNVKREVGAVCLAARRASHLRFYSVISRCCSLQNHGRRLGSVARRFSGVFAGVLPPRCVGNSI